ncbi:MAG: 30S ribosomal protein S13 [Thaumarchaeota archaeon 13_1_40CM_4_38_7]|nr:MAG: 30S ribosomal protein S13 [Thaumarchaeota archaeon 13_1_40CM_4_38_7]OLC92475.1 MAG: 30S ribosomal protein S13 [Thaumarchaeota archaeon 13_1_40CM_3_38_6]OLD41502.1 MAG: 30S ribosomal protein S13 [Thaumarchaeota archaeon 13_1_40CM_2_39_4]
MSSQEYRHIVRIAGKDIPGTKKTIIGISQVKGMGYNFAKSVLDILKINPNSNIGFLTESQVEEIEKAMKNPSSVNIPSWFLNRRKDIDSGKDLHLITSDIDFNVRNDIEREKNMNSWRGFRHTYGLKVRGQRTRTTGRKGGAVGVRKGGKILPAGVPAEGAAPAAAAGQAAAPAAAAGQAAPAAAAGQAAPAKGGAAAPKDTKTPATKPSTEKKTK